jgi:putative (di)nucleoside polyphosphate hydrolase
VVWKEKWRGQRQTWFLARFLGRDEDVNLQTAHPEFRAWRWSDIDDLPAMIVPFKKRLYEEVIAAFRPHL